MSGMKCCCSSDARACPVELSVQFEAFRALMEAEPLLAPKRPAVPGVSTHDSVVEQVPHSCHKYCTNAWLHYQEWLPWSAC